MICVCVSESPLSSGINLTPPLPLMGEITLWVDDLNIVNNVDEKKIMFLLTFFDKWILDLYNKCIISFVAKMGRHLKGLIFQNLIIEKKKKYSSVV